MGAWTPWRKIADRLNWYSGDLDWDGPACYELAIGGRRGGNLAIVYVGETGNEGTRISGYASHGSHLSRIIDVHLRGGWSLFYRAQIKDSKGVAKRMQDTLLQTFDYPWNRQP
jgi:hypothetical protein